MINLRDAFTCLTDDAVELHYGKCRIKYLILKVRTSRPLLLWIWQFLFKCISLKSAILKCCGNPLRSILCIKTYYYDFFGWFNFISLKEISKWWWWDVICAGVCTKQACVPYIWRIWFAGRGVSVAAQCLIYNGMLWHIWPLPKYCNSCDLEIALGHIAISIFLLIVQP